MIPLPLTLEQMFQSFIQKIEKASGVFLSPDVKAKFRNIFAAGACSMFEEVRRMAKTPKTDADFDEAAHHMESISRDLEAESLAAMARIGARSEAKSHAGKN